MPLKRSNFRRYNPPSNYKDEKMNTLREIIQKEVNIETGVVELTDYTTEQNVTKRFAIGSGEWEHVCITHENNIPEYEELVKLKEIAWKTSEIAMQVHPPKSEYVNIDQYELHLWRNKRVNKRNEEKLRLQILDAYKKAQKEYTGKEKAVLLSGEQKIVAVFGENRWPTWEEVCTVKQQYWDPEEAAVQFNLSYKEDINKEYCILLWDATDMLLPDKELV